MNRSNTIRSILLDSSVLAHSVLATVMNVEVPRFENRLLLLKARPAKSDPWLRSQIECLPTIAKILREGTVVGHTYFELEVEQYRGRNFPGCPLGNLFSGISLQAIKSPINRSLFEQTDINTFYSKDSQTSFFKWLMEEAPRLLLRQGILERLDQTQIDVLKKIGRYREICRSLSPTQYVDAWHLWTGELNGIPNFLTMDKKFVSALSANKQLTLACKPVFPIDWLTECKILDQEPMPFEYGKRYYLNGTPYD